MDEITLRRLMERDGLSIIGDMDVEERCRQFGFALKLVLPPRDLSDNACFRNLSEWLVNQCKKGKVQEHEIFRRVLDFAIESSGPTSKNPIAVFMYIIKKELHYLSSSKKE